MKKRYYLVFFFVLSFLTGQSQIGGEKTYQFLELTNSARIAALGGTQVAINDSTDLNLPFHNPALLHKAMENIMLVNYVSYFAGVNYGYASAAKSYEGIGNFALGMHYINYGDFKEATQSGELTGNNFTAAEYALNIMYSSTYKRLKYGATLKPVLSVFENYQSFGLLADFGASITTKNERFHFGIVGRNVGSQITTYYEDGNREPVPFELQAGMSTRLQHAPVVLSLTLQHLNHWDLAYYEPEEDPDITEVFEREESLSKQFMRHVVLGVEILPSENFILRAGYNYQRRQELKFEERLSTVGFSMGFGVRIKRFRLDFATSRFHLAGSSNLFSLAVNLN